MTKLPTLVVALLSLGLFVGSRNAEAAIIAFQGFETAGDTWGIESNVGGNLSSSGGGGDTPALQRILSGTRSYQVIGTTGTLDLVAVDTSAVSEPMRIVIRLTSTSPTTGNGADTNDTVQVFVALNGAAFPGTAEVTVAGAAATNARWGYDAVLSAVTTAGTPLNVASPQPGTNTNNYSTIIINLPGSPTSVDLRIVAVNTSSNEVWNFDDVRLETVPEPSMSALLGLSVLGLALAVSRRGRAIHRNLAQFCQ